MFRRRVENHKGGDPIVLAKFQHTADWGADRPQPREYGEFYQGYIDRVPEGNVLDTLRKQGQSMAALIDSLTPEQAAHRYAEGKWSVKEVMGHLVDSERVFTCRAMCIARGEKKPLPGYDQDEYMERAGFDRRSLESLAAEYRGLRSATLHLFNSFSEEAASRRGIANDQEITVRALAWIIAGHERHHMIILKERYGIG